ncbi:MAG: PAS domain-containing protein [Chitinophagaceae bacterium]|nr:PAS domain-containing protein [Chitinophagaceae bacterium]
MELQDSVGKQASIPEFLSGGGEMGQRIREHDWSKTPLGPVSSWPHSFRTCIRIMLTSRQPIWIGWGKELIKLYNDPYKAIVGGKHPWALGLPASVVWKDIWKDIEPLLRQVMEKDEGTYVESQLLIMERNGYPEETYYTFSYTPIPGDDGNTAGMICANTDDTDRIISERQLRTLTQLGKGLTDSQSNAEVIGKIISTLEDNPHDFPFALFYSISENKALLSHSTNLGDSAHLVPAQIDLHADNEISFLLNEAATKRKMQVLENVEEKIGRMPKGAWEIAPDKVIILPIAQPGAAQPYGFLVVGLNPYRLLEDKYASFFSLIADQVATSFSTVHALEEERKRVEALAEIDRAKTTFFSNISHEFRTPLTLLLGPIEDTLHNPENIEATRTRMDTAYRNALRMQRLVNTLLEFSRIEAGRVEGKFSAVDICIFTRDLASSFRSAIEKAGMQLEFHCDSINAEVYVDVDMWEKIVLNLVSNAFKYTKQGKVEITIIQSDDQVQLSVTDTGIGIPEDQLSKIFDRFHRIDNIEGRSQEGTGIGLALVRELVKIHRGKIEVYSRAGMGSTFTVTIPVGKDHLPADKIVDAPAGSIASGHSAAFVHEAMKWLPGELRGTEIFKQKENGNVPHQPGSNNKQKVLVADDNADMREYIERLLENQFQVMVAVDGEDAFNKLLSFKPDLVVSDIMMPKLDGFGLLNKLHGHPDTKNIPVIFLSARAGEEAKLEGLDAGADDYLVKPFSAKELIVTVNANIKIAKNRKAAEDNLKNIIMQSPVSMTILRGKDMVMELANEKSLEIWGKTHEDVINRPLRDGFPELVEQGFTTILNNVYTTGEPFAANEMPVTMIRYGESEMIFVNFIFEPLRNSEGVIEGVIGVGVDVSEQVISRKKIEESEKGLNELANALPQLVWVAASNGDVLYYNDRVAEFSGAVRNTDGNWSWGGLVHESDLAKTERAWKKAVEQGTVYQIEHRIQVHDGDYRWFLSRAIPQRDEHGNIIKWFGTATDIHASKEQATILEEEVKKRTHELKELNISLQQSNNELQQFAHVASHDLKEPLRKIRTFTERLTVDPGSSFSENSKMYIRKVNSATDRMHTMIEGVLNYSMISSSEQNIQPVDLNEVIQDIEADLELLIKEKSAIIYYKDLPTIQGAAVLLYQLFYNLINNSLKFTLNGQSPRINISSSILKKDQAGFAEIRIEDNGIGFEHHEAEKIFNTFSRLNLKDQFEGTGLGLSLCKRIVARHGGNIEAIGKINEGAVFVVQLPVNQPANYI